MFFRDKVQHIRDTKPLIQMSPQSTSDFIPIDSPREDYLPSFESDVQLNLVTRQYNVQEIGDIILLEHEDFIADNDFISSKEFNTFLCQHKGKKIRDVMKEKIEEEKILKLQEEVHLAMREMTPENGRQLLKDVGVLIYSGWDMRSALLFDSFHRKHDPTRQIMPDEVDKIFMGSGYDPDQKALMLWALYPKEKRPILVDTIQAFGHLLVQQARNTDPRNTTRLNLDVAKLNQDQTEFLARENNTYKGLYEKAIEEIQKLQEQFLQQAPVIGNDQLDTMLQTNQ